MSTIDITDRYYTNKGVDQAGIQFNLARAQQSNTAQRQVPQVDLQKEYEDKPEDQKFDGNFQHDPQQVSLGGLDPIQDMDITRNGCLSLPHKTYAYEEAAVQNRFIGMGYTFGQNASNKICNPWEREQTL